MQGFTIQSKRSKAEAFLEIRDAILSLCDEDIKLAFAIHSFTIEPLLIQLIREVKLLRSERSDDEHNRSTPTSTVRATSDATERDNEIVNRESEFTPKTPTPRTMG